MPSAVIKEEPDADPVKIKEEKVAGKNEDASGEDPAECPRESSNDPSNGEANMPVDSQNGSAGGNQPILNSVKQENEHNNPSDELPTGESTELCEPVAVSIVSAILLLLLLYIYR